MNLCSKIPAMAAGLLFATSIAHAQTFVNTDTLLLPGLPGHTAGPASIYPSTIVVSGLGGTIVDVNVTISSVTHSFSDDIDLLLVGPNGLNVMLMAGAGGSTSLQDAWFTFDDQAADFMPNTSPALVSGFYKPTSYRPLQGMPDPAPQGPYGSLLSVFNGTDPNGAWKLYAADDGAADTGQIEGWSIEFTVVPSPAALTVLAFGWLCGRSRRRT